MFKHQLRCSSQLLNLGDRLCEQVIKKRSAPKLKSSPYNMNLFQQSKTCRRLPRALVIFVPARLFLLDLTPLFPQHRVVEVMRGHGGPPPKSLDSDENFKPEHTLFCRELRFVAIYALFGDLWAKKCLFGSKTVFLGQEVHYHMVYIFFYHIF